MKTLFAALIVFLLNACSKLTDNDLWGGAVITTNTIATHQGNVQVKYLNQSVDTTKLNTLVRQIAFQDTPQTWEQSYDQTNDWNLWNWTQYDTVQTSQQNPAFVLKNTGGAWASSLDGVYYLSSNSKIRIPYQQAFGSRLRIALQIYISELLIPNQPSMLIQQGHLDVPKTPYWGLSVEPNGKLKLVLRDSTTTLLLLSTAAIPLQQWTRVELTLSPNQASLLLNQQKILDSIWSTPNQYTNTQDIRIALDSLVLNDPTKNEYATIHGLLDYIAIQNLNPSTSTTLSSSSSAATTPISSSSLNSGTITDARDGKSYKTIVIGNQTWMAENLNYATPSGSYCYWNDPLNCNTFGRLYTWTTALNNTTVSGDPIQGPQGICPTGWHLPSRLEWETLALNLGDSSRAAKSMKGQYNNSDWLNSAFHNGNLSGFGGLPGGFKDDIPPSELDNGVYKSIGVATYYWSATELGTAQALARGLYASDSALSLESVNKTYSLSVRCLRD